MVAAALFARPFGVTARVAVAARSGTLLVSRGKMNRTGRVALDHRSRGGAVRDVPGEPAGYARAVAAVSGQRVRQVGYAKAGGVEHRTPFDGCHSTRGYRRPRRP